MGETIFADGLKVSEHKFDNGGTITKLAFKVEDFVTFMQVNENEKGWVNIDICRGQSGKLYAKLNTYKKEQ